MLASHLIPAFSLLESSASMGLGASGGRGGAGAVGMGWCAAPGGTTLVFF